MLKTSAGFRAAAITCAAALAMASVAAVGNVAEEEHYWFAAGDPTTPNGQLWTTGYGECWQSAGGPSNLPPCQREVAVPEEFTVRLNFEFDRYQVPENVVNTRELARLDEFIADVLETEADEFLTVVGHTDSVGSEQYNYQLGLRRASAVRDYMISQGISPDRIAEPVSQGKLAMLPQYPPDSVFQRRVKIHSEVN
jgi:OOP family OmpA-OmpF porin